MGAIHSRHSGPVQACAVRNCRTDDQTRITSAFITKGMYFNVDESGDYALQRAGSTVTYRRC